MALDRVVDSVILDGAMVATANAIREKTGSAKRIVWNETKGFSDSVGDVYEVGKKAVWSLILGNGDRTDLSHLCRNWYCEYIYPPYKIVPNHVNSRNHTFAGNPLLKRVEKNYFDFSQCPRGTSSTQHGWYYTFNGCTALEVIEDVGINNAYSFNDTFIQCRNLHTIECIYPDENTIFSTAFNNCISLVYLRVNGVIGQNGFDIRWSTKLSKDSILSIVNALSPTTSGLTVTFSEAAVKKAFATSEGANDGNTSSEWLALVATKENWNIALA
jgi:hypothetical protein